MLWWITVLTESPANSHGVFRSKTLDGSVQRYFSNEKDGTPRIIPMNDSRKEICSERHNSVVFTKDFMVFSRQTQRVETVQPERDDTLVINTTIVGRIRLILPQPY